MKLESGVATGRPTRRPWADGFAIAVLVAAAVFLLWRMVAASVRENFPRSYDIYSAFMPNTLYAADRLLHHGGRGFLWNPFQDCGQPFFGTGTQGVLYPPALLFLVLDADRALQGLLLFNLVVGAVGAYWLGREFGLHPIAATCGGVAFGFSHAVLDNISSTPIVSGPYAWFPWGMLFCERLLRAPTLRSSVALGVVLTLSLLPGHPQGAVYLYELIVARVIWEIAVTRRLPLHALGAVALGLVLPPLLGAVSLLPGVEVSRASIRNADLGLADMSPLGFYSWAHVVHHVLWRSEISNAVSFVPLLLAAVAPFGWRWHRQIAFYALAGLVSFDLAFGPNGISFGLYRRLPLGTLFKDPHRFLWVTAFCIAALVAFGVDVVTGPETGDRSGRRRVLAVLPAALGLLAVHRLLPGGVPPELRTPVVAALVAIALAAALPRLRAIAGPVCVAALILELVVARNVPMRHLAPSAEILVSHPGLFAFLRERMTPQDRLYLVPKHADNALQHKTGMLFGVPSLFDYEGVMTKRYAEYFTTLLRGKPMTSLNDILFIFEEWLRPELARPLLNAAAARYVVTPPKVDTAPAIHDPPLRFVATVEDKPVYENPAALPRAHFVQRVEVVPDSGALLRRLAKGTDDLRTVALVEEPPPGGGMGGDGAAGEGSVTFARDDPEDVLLEVDAPADGFVLLADQHFPGWRATVNGTPAPILRADYVFRLVRVPRGHSTVEFRYLPVAVGIGALVSGVTIALMGLVLVRTRRAQRGEASVIVRAGRKSRS